MPSPEKILKEFWGFDQFRPLQREIIESILTGKDTLAILPTGGGKSICFQVPALSLDGICLVVSPLIALMKDQVDNLAKKNIPALFIHSGMSRKDVIRTLENAREGYFRFLYLSPERLETNLFKEYLPALNVSLVAIDEAHCISQWGYDFRPSYLRIAALREEIPQVPFLALTASATPEVQKDICEKLLLQKPEIFKQSFERKNLSYSSFQPESKLARLIEIVSKVQETTIVYCNSRRRTVEIAKLLKLQGHSADSYHAGLDANERTKRQKAWVDDQTRIMVCTNAFGMGIDKPDVRLVVHMDIPDCLENYYQEAGRAGRDGRKSYAVLLYDGQDLEELKQLHTKRFPSIDKIKKLYEQLVNHLQIPAYGGAFTRFPFRLEEFISKYELNPHETLYAIKALELDGWIEYNERNYSPSTIEFTANRRSLHEFYQTHPELEPLLTTLLRTYGGIFDFSIPVSEYLLARLLRKEETEIKEGLIQAHRYGMIKYSPRDDEPGIVFLKQRVPVHEFQMDEKSYFRRKEIFASRTRAIIKYAVSSSCRSQLINQYFGEEKTAPCGICDNCLEQKRTGLSTAEFKQYSDRLMGQLAQTPFRLDDLPSLLNGLSADKIEKLISFLQSENRVWIDGEGVLRPWTLDHGP